MRIEYRVRYFDYLRFNVVHQFLSPTLQVVYLLFGALIFMGERSDNSVIGSFIVAFVFYSIMWAAQAILTAIYLTSRRGDSVLTDHVVEIRDNALFESTKYNESLFFWPGILKVRNRPGYIAVYIAQHMAHIIPKRAFSSKDQVNQFVALIKEKMSAA